MAQISASREPQENLATMVRESERAADAGSQVIVFPEATMRRFGGSLRDVAEPLDGPWATAVRELAQRTELTVIAGMFTPADDRRVRNTLLITGRGADTHYHKIHLFDAYGFSESDTVAPGSDLVTVAIDGIEVGVATCYDIRFPGLFQSLADRGAQIVVVPSSWGRGPGKVEQWTLLAQARALDSTSYIVACDQADPAVSVQQAPGEQGSGEQGSGSAPLGVGHSMVVAPDGIVMDSLGNKPGMLTVDLDIAEVDRVRKILPVLGNRRF